MLHRHWQPDALLQRRTRLLIADRSGLWLAVEDDAARLLYHSGNAGRSWRLASTGLPAAARITALLTDSRGLLLATQRRGLYRSVDRGATWHATGSEQLHDQGISALVHWNGLLFAGTHASGVWRSRDGGRSWQSASQGLPLAGRGLHIMALAPMRAGVVASHAFGLHKAETASWTLASTGLPCGAVFPWLGTASGVLIAGGVTGLYLSPDMGSSWTHAFPPAASQLVTTSLAAGRGTLFAGTMHPSRGSGLYRSSDGGATWFMLCEGLADELTPFHLAPFPGGVAVGTRDRGVWISPLGDRGSSRSPCLSDAVPPLVLQQNQPNPFSRTTTIAYALRRAGIVRLDVRDVAGREIARLADAFHAAGAYEVAFDAGELEGGFYTCRLTLGGLSQSRQMLVLK